MANLLLSLILVVAQLFSCGAVPLYLCACGSKSVCIDAGPDNCDCCHDAVAGASNSPFDHDHDADHGPASCVDSHRETAEPSAALGVACDCRHVALAGLSGPAIATASESSGTDRFAGPPTTSSATFAGHCSGLSVLGAEFSGPSRPTFYASSVIGTIVLRC